jgi:hypothetical protein
MLVGVPPALPSWAAQQVGGYLGYTGRVSNMVATTALDPKLARKSMRWCGPAAVCFDAEGGST